MAGEFDWEFLPDGGGVFSVLSKAEAENMARMMSGKIRHNPIGTSAGSTISSFGSASVQQPLAARRQSPRKKPSSPKPRAQSPKPRAARSSIRLSRLVQTGLSESPDSAVTVTRLVEKHRRGRQNPSRHTLFGMPLLITTRGRTTTVAFAMEGRK